ncbi:hypothetical protein SORBI_3005G102000 [Sorghum bicolor]|uniref:Uncharacterized protein n=2 Tax=Sorghum bicolor TaxID=4558 RepID=A0A1B6PRE3_SORBI|nr:hypothetical protein SORBI_3005G102000 [Sorghum bicolor]
MRAGADSTVWGLRGGLQKAPCSVGAEERAPGSVVWLEKKADMSVLRPRRKIWVARMLFAAPRMCACCQQERGIGRFFMNINYIFCCIKIFFTRTIWYYVLQNEIFLFLGA